ncbi:type II toxin-antitoxin system RelE/ParE family toxin [Budvicia diplopodorum]|uniref:type II toxin-antitoxin system RelE/ParE family toxin n=1 Tax=Budvicia diplopodorum TaxID=1119056 RepID=UPI00135A3ED1|nr:type II toxin-antitoxin system RelE/ParE family toxin [Budvicia diplopodorum]
MKVIWADNARQDREEIWNHISSHSPKAAVKLDELFSSFADKLTEYPLLGAKGKISGTRELILHENYRLVYEVDMGVVYILALVHTARKWPNPEQDHDK